MASHGLEEANADSPDGSACHYDPDLPITAHRAEIVGAIRRHPVVVVAGETGSGKTTQIPKFCLEAGRGTEGLIGCTQPRRIAARAVAERVAEELDVALGGTVGYQVRFTQRIGADTRVKFMTDGILLAETQGDRRLAGYDTLILDEAHERSLNIDFLLGYLRRLLDRRKDLKLVITSATIDTQRFAEHFGDAPVVEVSGRGYPVDVRYRPPAEGRDDLKTQVADALAELDREKPPGDTLVFVSGEREIRDLSGHLRKHRPPGTEVLPLYGRLSAAAQHKVFHPGRGRRVVIATNVAETSLTVPRIRFVIDTGLARTSRYSPRSKIQRLPIEPISQASAAQRAGRCGRLGPGVCIRLYSQDDFDERPEFTEPEILRTNLAAVILRMKALRLGAVEDFPFLDKPSKRQIADGYQLLTELGALDGDRRLTGIGRRLSRLPVDPRLGRMILAAERRRCLPDMLVIAAGLSVRDPRERPMDARQKADEAHAAFADERSDFAGLLKLWRAFETARREQGSSALKRWCRTRFLSHGRLREWREIHRQLQGLAKEMKLEFQGGGGYADLHRALLSGLLSHTGRRDDEDGDYEAPRQRRFLVHPASALAARPPKWLLSAELVETSRVFARTNARVKPTWIEQAAGHLVKRQYFEPWYDRRTARVKGFEQVSLFGLVLVERRVVDYGPVRPTESRRLFIRHALARFEYDTDAAFMQHNRAVVEEVRELEYKQRRHDVLAHESALMQFFEQRLPADVHTGKRFERWRREAEADDPRRLYLDKATLMRHQAVDVTAESYPETLTLDGLSFALSYYFEPGHAADGVTVEVPVHRLANLDVMRLEWLVPGLIRDKLTAILKGLPKNRRRHFVPVPDYVQALLEALDYGTGDLYEATARELSRITGIRIKPATLRAVQLPEHLYFNLAVVDDKGECLAQGRDPAALGEALADSGRKAFAELSGQAYQRDGLRDWAMDALPASIELKDGGKGFPALTDQGDGAGVRVFQTADEARAAHRDGLVRLVTAALPDKVKYLKRHSPISDRACLHYAALDSCEALKSDCIDAVFRDLCGDQAPDVRDRRAFEQLVARVRKTVLLEAERLGERVNAILEAYFTLACRLDDEYADRWPEATEAAADQLAWLVWAGFVRDCTPETLRHYPRYLEALERRLDGLPNDPGGDRQKQQLVAPWWDAYLALVAERGWPGGRAMENLRWLIEEYRVSVFAQKLGTARPVSEKRLRRALAEAEG